MHALLSFSGDVGGGRQRCAGLAAVGFDRAETELLSTPQSEPNAACNGAAGPSAPHTLHLAQSNGESTKWCHLVLFLKMWYLFIFLYCRTLVSCVARLCPFPRRAGWSVA